jgi:type IV pilus assembly protein PilC
VFGRLAVYYQMTNFCRTTGLLLKSGVEIPKALRITADTTDNLVYKEIYIDLSAKVVQGKSISEVLDGKTKYFPDLVPQMILIGEGTGRLVDTLLYLSEMYEHEVEEITSNLSSAMEPALMVFIGVVVGFIAVSIISPIYEVTQRLSK